MKIALAMMVTEGEAPYLRLHLPVYKCAVDGIMVVFERGEYIEDEVAAIKSSFPEPEWIVRDFHNDWGEMFNFGIDAVEHSQCRYDALLRIDPDEAMFSSDVDKVRSYLETYDLLWLSRINYWMDREHYSPQYGHDYQARAWRLNCGIRLSGQHHESVSLSQHTQVNYLPDVTIHHYGDIGRERVLKRDLHYLNVAREQAGHPPLTERPADREFPTRENVLYTGPQPIDPNVVGKYAPFKE